MSAGAPAIASEGHLPRWRIAAGCFVLGGLLFFAAWVGPLYLHNWRLQNYVGEITRNVANQTKSDDAVRTLILEKAQSLGLPVTADNVQIVHSGEALRIDVRYAVRVDLPGYTVDLHFYPGAGSR